LLAGPFSPITGTGYFVASGLQKQKGWDASIAYSPIPEWQIMVTGFKGTTKDQNGSDGEQHVRRPVLVFTRYEFSGGSLKGFQLRRRRFENGRQHLHQPRRLHPADGFDPDVDHAGVGVEHDRLRRPTS
jgi:hypothetical protein